MKKRLSLFMTIILVFLTCSNVFASLPSDFQTEAIFLMETNTGKILYEKNASQKMYPASTTKILTALLALELADPKDTVVIGKEVYTVPLDASKAGHLPGDEILLQDLLMGLLLPSGNDSAVAVATYIAKKETGNPNLSLDESIHYFSELANERAKKTGANQTHFVNPHGYHDDNHYTTAHDLALIAQEAMKNPQFRNIVKTYTYTMDDKEKQRVIPWRNRNLLLDSNKEATYYPYATGIKTGFTTPAGECLVASATKGDLDLIAVLLNSPKDQRWTEAKILFEYGFNNFEFHQIITSNEVAGKIQMSKQKPKGPNELEVTATEGFAELLKSSDIPKIQKQILWKEELLDPNFKEENKLLAPIEEKQIVGTVQYTLNNQILAEIPLAASSTIERRTIWDVLFSIKAIPIWFGVFFGLFILRFLFKLSKKRKRKTKGFRFR
ncbi:MAG: D-alanyl-D-alanine carboxypeptidase [Epulopiscium sp.]|nr:D-alanyl-D-alanine carboxypeptidase [Candidatus Epulonipiscium sp.]